MITINEHLLEQHSLGYYLDIALRSMIGEVNTLLRKNNVNLQHSQFSLMLYLEKKEGINQSELANITGKNPAAILRSVNYLESKGYVSRKAKSGCENMIFLTDIGKALLPLLNTIALDVTRKAVCNISEEENKLLISLLNHIGKNFLIKK